MTVISPTLSPDKVWLGITPTLWWNDDFPSIDIGIPFEQCISEMALAGYKGCSVGHKYPTDPSVLRPALELRGLKMSEPWVSTYFTAQAMREQTFEKVRQQLKFMDEMDGGSSDPRRADLVVAEFGGAANPQPIALFPNCPEFTEAQWKDLLSGIDAIGKMAHDAGRLLCYHPHLGTGVMRRDAIDRLMAGTDPTYVHLLLDTGHLKAAGVDPYDVTVAYAKRIRHIHLKDIRQNIVDDVVAKGLSFQQGVEDGIFTVPGNGSIQSFPAILRTLAEAEFAGWLVIEAEQDPAKANPLTYAAMARDYLRQTLGW